MKASLLTTISFGVLSSLWCSGALAQPGWVELESGTTNDLHAVHFVDVVHGYAVGATGVGLSTVDAGATWQAMPMGVNIDLNDVDFLGATGVAVGSGGTILRTTDSGANWTQVPSGVFDDLLSVTLSGTKGICGGQSQTILYTTNGGASWLISQSGFFGGGFPGTAMVSPDIGFVGGQNSIFQPLAGRSLNGGVSWDFTAFYLNGNEGAISAIDFTDMNIGYATSHVWDGRGAISKTTDGGQNWSTTFFANPINGIDFPLSDASLVGYAVGDLGRIRKTGDAGASWQGQDSGTSAALHGVCFLDFDNGYVVGDGGTILKTTTGGESGAPVNDDPSRLPQDIVPVRAAPNPFMRTTEFRFQMSHANHVSLVVFDVAGRKIRTLLDGQTGAGSLHVPWDGADDSGRAQQSGIYGFRLVAGDAVTTGTVLLVR